MKSFTKSLKLCSKALAIRSVNEKIHGLSKLYIPGKDFSPFDPSAMLSIGKISAKEEVYLMNLCSKSKDAPSESEIRDIEANIALPADVISHLCIEHSLNVDVSEVYFGSAFALGNYEKYNDKIFQKAKENGYEYYIMKDGKLFTKDGAPFIPGPEIISCDKDDQYYQEKKEYVSGQYSEFINSRVPTADPKRFHNNNRSSIVFVPQVRIVLSDVHGIACKTRSDYMDEYQAILQEEEAKETKKTTETKEEKVKPATSVMSWESNLAEHLGKRVYNEGHDSWDNHDRG